MRYLLPDGWLYRKNLHLGFFLPGMPIVQITQCTRHPILFGDLDHELDDDDDDDELDDADADDGLDDDELDAADDEVDAAISS